MGGEQSDFSTSSIGRDVGVGLEAGADSVQTYSGQEAGRVSSSQSPFPFQELGNVFWLF